MPRGGRRLGAGAPKGNINALKHGRHASTREVKELIEEALSDPKKKEKLIEFLRQLS